MVADAHPLTSERIKHLASEALSHPRALNPGEIQELGASVMRHIEPRNGGDV